MPFSIPSICYYLSFPKFCPIYFDFKFYIRRKKSIASDLIAHVTCMAQALKKKLSLLKVIKLNKLFLKFLLVLYLNQIDIFLNEARSASPQVEINNRTNVDPTLDANFRLSVDSRNDNDVLRWYNTSFQRCINIRKYWLYTFINKSMVYG